MKFSSRKIAGQININYKKLYRLSFILPKELLERNVNLALNNVHYQPIYSIKELSNMMSISKYKTLNLVKSCGIQLYWVGRKRIVLLSDLEKLNNGSDYLKRDAF